MCVCVCVCVCVVCVLCVYECKKECVQLYRLLLNKESFKVNEV